MRYLIGRALMLSPAIFSLTVMVGFVTVFFNQEIGAKLIVGGFCGMILTLVVAMASE